MRPAAAALAVAAPLAAVLWSARLPASLTGSWPRAFGWRAAAAFTAFARSRPGRVTLPLTAYAGLVAAAALLIFELRARSRKGDGQRPDRWLRAAAVVAGCALLARMALVSGLDLLQNVAFAPESMSILEPFATLAWLFVVSWLALRAAAEALAPRRAAGFACALAALGLAAQGLAAARFDGGRRGLSQAAALPEPPSGWRAVAILGGDGGKPTQETYQLRLGREGASDYGSARLAAAERYARLGPSVYRRAALSFLYSGYAFEADADGLGRALDLGVSLDDPLARALALDRLACEPATDRALKRVEALADDGRFVIGPQAAAKVAAAYARLGHPAAARAWKERAEAGPDGVAPGLLDLPAAAPLGRVDGRLDGLPGARVGLYCRPDAYSPYALGPAQLAASAVVGRDGRFSFDRLPPGSYFLAVSADEPAQRAAPWKLLGDPGDLVVSARRSRLVVRLRAK